MAVGLEWAHAEFVGQGESLAVVGCGQRHVWGTAMCGNLAEEAQGIRLVAAFLVRTGMRQLTLGKGVRLLQAASQYLRFPSGRRQRVWKSSLSIAVVCSIACVSSGMASATRPARLYASPKAVAILGK